jgi:hypothetical protein
MTKNQALALVKKALPDLPDGTLMQALCVLASGEFDSAPAAPAAPLAEPDDLPTKTSKGKR